MITSNNIATKEPSYCLGLSSLELVTSDTGGLNPRGFRKD